MYLKVMTWTEPGMDENAIYGTLQDLRRLAGIIDAKLQDADLAPNFGFRKISGGLRVLFGARRPR